MTQSYKPTQPIRILGVEGARVRRLTSTRHTAIPGHQRSSPNPCGLFSGSKTEIKPSPSIDLDNDMAFMNSIMPKLEPQLSVLSTDSGILPRDIRNSSFVDDVIGELTSQGICHSDIISVEAAEAPMPEVVMAPLEVCRQVCKRKASSLLPSPNSIDTNLDNCSPTTSTRPTSTGFCTVTNEEIKRIKNNEASRKSRAHRKRKNAWKETEIASLEEENQRLTLLLKDFNEVAATCKQWLVQKMENPAEA